MRIKDTRPLKMASTLLTLLIAARLAIAILGLNMIINLTPSIQKGIYRIVPLVHLNHAKLIVFNIPIQANLPLGKRPWLNPEYPLIKPVGAVAGDHVCIDPKSIYINNKAIGKIYSSDYLGQPIPVKTGCYTIPPDQVLPISTYNDRSFDGRYFGPIDVKDIIGEAIPVFTW